MKHASTREALIRNETDETPPLLLPSATGPTCILCGATLGMNVRTCRVECMRQAQGMITPAGLAS
jgi:hypothetical protein